MEDVFFKTGIGHAGQTDKIILFIFNCLLPKIFEEFSQGLVHIICNESAALCLSNTDGFPDTKRTYSTQKGGGYCYTKFYSLHKNTAFDTHQILFSHINLRILGILFKQNFSPVHCKSTAQI